MGDDPIIPDLSNEAVSHGAGGSATGGNAFHIRHDHGLSKGGQLFVVVASCLALGLAVGAVVINATSGAAQRELHESQIDSLKAEVEESKTETRMLEYYLLELDAKAIAAGIKRPEEAIANKLKEN